MTDRKALLEEWWKSVQAMTAAKALIDREQMLRKLVFAEFFPAPVEGTNKIDIENGWQLKAVHKLDRKIDEAALPSTLDALRKKGISADSLVRYKPEIQIKAFKGLTKEDRDIFSACLTTKPGSPTLDLIPPPESKDQ